MTDNPNLTSYSWDFGDSTASTIPQPYHYYSEADTYQVTLMASDIFACGVTIDSLNVFVSEMPEAGFITATDTLFCMGENALLMAPSEGVSYLWSTGSTASEITVTQTGSYKVTVTLENGCYYVTQPIQITVNPLPIATINPSTPFIDICQGDSITLQILDGYNYQWTNGSNTSSVEITTSGAFAATVTDPVTGCFAFSNVVAVLVHPNPSPPTITPQDVQFCEGETNTLSAEHPNLSNFVWNTGQVAQNIVVFSPGEYSVVVSDQYGCSSSGLVDVLVNNTPDASSLPIGCYTICPDDSISLFLPADVFPIWHLNGNYIGYPIVQGNIIYPQESGEYQIVLITPFYCTDTSGILTLDIQPVCSPPLPVSLITFTGTVQPHDNLLQWTTAAEVNNAYFTLQYSPDGNEFTPFAQITGAGTTSTTKSYQHTHNNPYPLTYYRLLQTDYDGTTRQAGEVITLIRNQPTTGFTLTHILPNPTRNTATITYISPTNPAHQPLPLPT